MKENTNTNARAALRTCIPMLLICALLLTGATYAWFSGYWVSKPGTLSFGTSGIEYPTMTAWTYLTPDEGSTSSSGEWVAETCEGDGEKKLGEITVTETENIYTYTLSQLHFGTVDNLLTVKNDNILYFRFEVDRARFGENITLSIAPFKDVTVGGTDYAFELYDGREDSKNGNYKLISDSDIYTSVQAVLSESDLILTSYCVSGSELAPDDAGFDDLTFTQMEGDSADLTATSDSATYVYLKMMPNFTTMGNISKALIQYMPSVILYNLQIQLSLRNYVV